MTDYVQWGDVPTSGGSGERSDFLKLETGGSYRIRPLFDPVCFFKYFHKKDGRLRTAICAKPDTCSVRDEHPELKPPSMRFAAYVIDRSDGKVKILEAPQTVFRPIGSSFEATGKNPGSGKDGSDWLVKVTGKGLNTKYDVAFAGNTPLSAEERAMVKEAMDGDMKKLKKLYKTNTPEEIKEKLFGDLKNDDGESSGSFSSHSQASAVSASHQVEAADSESSDGDDFDASW